MNEAKNQARERELDKTTALYNAATDYAAYVNSNKHDYDEAMKLSDALEAAAVAYAELAGDREPVMTKTPAISTLVSSNGSVAAYTDQLKAWQCGKCGRYHHKAFPDEGCDECDGAAIAKRLGLSQPPNS